jgi:predicted PurR-regulated permease PerM
MNNKSIHQKSFHILLVIVTVGFAAILFPFFSAVFWGVVLSLIFQPMQNWLSIKLRNKPNMAAMLTLSLIIVLVILPTVFVAGTLIQEVSTLYQRIKSGQINIADYLSRSISALPLSAQHLLTRYKLTDFDGIQTKLTAGAGEISQLLASKVLTFGHNTVQFVIGFGVMLYLMFFLLRDGRQIGRDVHRTLPFHELHKTHLIAKFTTVVRSTVKGNVVVALVQGTLGGIIFLVLGIEGAILWGVLMAFMSLVPAMGAALIWGPAAVLSCRLRRVCHRSCGQCFAAATRRKGNQVARLGDTNIHAWWHEYLWHQRLCHWPVDRGLVHV